MTSSLIQIVLETQSWHVDAVPSRGSPFYSLERRVYELAHKHCGDKAMWKCGIDILQEKCGSKQTARKFKQEILDIIERDSLPRFHTAIDESVKPNDVVFYSRDHKKVLFELNKTGKIQWFGTLIQKKTI